MKLVLDTKELTDDFFEETKLLGIMVPVKNYQLRPFSSLFNLFAA